jgi:hypothetical protein
LDAALTQAETSKEGALSLTRRIDIAGIDRANTQTKSNAAD